MENQKGYSLIELIIVIALVMGVGLTAFTMVSGGSTGNLSMGLNGMTEVRCIGGYKHTVGANGQARQMVNENGGGISCH